MKIKKKRIVIGILSILIISFGGFLSYKYENDKEQRTQIEKTIITANDFWGNEVAKKVEKSTNEEISQGNKKDTPKVSPGDKKNDEFINLTYKFNENNTHDYIGGDNDYTKTFDSAISDKSTEKEFLPEVNKAVCYLTQGAYENNIRDQFVGKVWHGKKIKDCKINYYKVNDNLNKNDYKVLQEQGIDRLPDGDFTVVVGSYNKPHDDTFYYVRVLVIFE